MVQVRRVSRIHLLKPRKSAVLNAVAADYLNGQFNSNGRSDQIKNNPQLNRRRRPHQPSVVLRPRHSSPIKVLARHSILSRPATTNSSPCKRNISINTAHLPQVPSFTNSKSIHLSGTFQSQSDENRRRDRKRRGVFLWWKFCCCCLYYALLLSFGLAALIVALVGGSQRTTLTSTSLITPGASVTTASISPSSASPAVTNISTTTTLSITLSTLNNLRLNMNLLINGDGETGPCESGGNVTHPSVWTSNGTIIQLYYNNSVYVTASTSTPGPSDRGGCFFFGQNSASSSMWQTVNLTNGLDPLLIDNQTIKFNLSAWLGGWQNQDDNARATISFFDQTNQMVGNSTTIGPVLAADRNNITSLIFRQSNGFVPVGARSFTVIVTLTRVVIWDNDAIVDNVAVTLFQ